jgi:hypothetical protein
MNQFQNDCEPVVDMPADDGVVVHALSILLRLRWHGLAREKVVPESRAARLETPEHVRSVAVAGG